MLELYDNELHLFQPYKVMMIRKRSCFTDIKFIAFILTLTFMLTARCNRGLRTAQARMSP